MHRHFIACLIALTAVNIARADGDWPQWRGPSGNGHTEEKGIPVRWDAKSVAWKTALPGAGQSSPVVWGDRVFLTSALDKGAKRLVLCVDRKTGSILWQDEAWSGSPEPSHKMNGWASATCATDGQRVVIDVHDSGSGLSEEAGATLFEPTITFKKDGMGLGLSIAKKNALLSGGDVSVVSGELGGAAFRVTLPAAAWADRREQAS